ncbi:MAG: 4-aminobutyrate aminotransferase [Candidatus Peregrinibacteria bacterium Greene0416_19]|nr:MAG: 4-aminobutyrate aminotransferase [Candidatus Peregrinibacteria bacterium Greene0416_19]
MTTHRVPQPHVACSWALDTEIVAGKGCILIDREGREIIDFAGGWCVGTHGWGEQRIAEAVCAEARRGLYVPPTFQWAGWEELAALLCSIAPGGLSKVYRCCSGSEAVEFAIKCARAATGRDVIVSVDGVYHGHTYGAASVGNAIGRHMGSGLPHCEKITFPHTIMDADRALSELAALVKKGDVAGFISEPVFSNAGVRIPPPDFYPRVQELCRAHGALFMMDEVAVGFGRCGTLFASELWGLSPDVLCLGKALTGGYGTLGATLVTQDVFDRCDGIPDYVTFGWTPINVAATLANLRLLLERRLTGNARTIGAHMLRTLQGMRDEGLVRDVRGMGLLLGLTPPSHINDLQQRCLDLGLFVEGWAEPDGTPYTLISPPLILDEETADRGLAILRSALTA